LKTVFTVRKYDPIGNVIMANVKPSSFAITELLKVCISVTPGRSER
jgi:hypothetical protein